MRLKSAGYQGQKDQGAIIHPNLYTDLCQVKVVCGFEFILKNRPNAKTRSAKTKSVDGETYSRMELKYRLRLYRRS